MRVVGIRPPCWTRPILVTTAASASEHYGEFVVADVRFVLETLARALQPALGRFAGPAKHRLRYRGCSATDLSDGYLERASVFGSGRTIRKR